ncbi:MAG TPA: tetratricopeptide repeat protein [Candidatus Binataceae bacterium]|nr:tetratricopeptide repeat protein [Candidatus Binataceae bacterium]
MLTAIGCGDAQTGAIFTGIALVTAALYVRCLNNGFVFDDDDMIVTNRFIGSWSYIWDSIVNDTWWFRDPLHLPQGSYYRPLQGIWFTLNYHLFGPIPLGWHAAMIALHLLVVWLVFRVSLLLTSDRMAGLGAAALFALMPIHAEPVAWASAIPLPLAAAFEMAAFEFYLRWNAEPDTAPDRSSLLVISMALFAGALLSHESAVAFPALVAMHALILDRQETSHANDTVGIRANKAIAAAVPYALEVAVYLGIRYAVLGFITRPNIYNHMAAMQSILTMPAAAATYAMVLVVPWLAGPSHLVETVSSIAAPGFYIPVLGFAVFGAAALARLKRDPRRRLHLFCMAWIPIALAPVLNLGGLFPDAIVQDRYLYLPSFGFCVLAADIAITFARQRRTMAYAISVGAAVFAVVCAVSLYTVQDFWHDEIALFGQCVREIPKSGFYRNRLGMALQGRGELSAARKEFETAAQLDPDNGWNYYDLGLVFLGLGDQHSAAQAMAQGIAKFKSPPPGAYTELAIVADAAGDSAQADAALKQAAAIPGGSEIAGLTRAQLLFHHGDKSGAENIARDLLMHDPNNPDLLTFLGSVLSAGQRYEDALKAYERAAAINPNARSLHYQIALALHKLGRNGEARSECSIAIASAPDDRDARELMAELEQNGASR